MATTKEAISESYPEWFSSPATILSLSVYTQRQQLAQQQQIVCENEKLLDDLTSKKSRLITALNPSKEYKASFDTEMANIQKEIDFLNAQKYESFEEEKERLSGINELKDCLQLCQTKFNEEFDVAYFKQQEKLLKELDTEIEKLKQSIEQQQVNLNSLQSILAQAEKNLARKKTVLAALGARYIENIAISLTDEQMQALKR